MNRLFFEQNALANFPPKQDGPLVDTNCVGWVFNPPEEIVNGRVRNPSYSDTARASRLTLARISRFLLLACLGYCITLSSALAEPPQIKFDGTNTFEVVGLSKDSLKSIEATLADKNAPAPLAVYLVADNGKPAKTPLNGATSIENGILRFRARFPPGAGQTYRAIFQPKANDAQSTVLTQAFSIPKKASAPATTITAVYPTQDLLPENQLKFYLHFSAPMSRGEVYRYVHLLNEKGDAIALPFLELEQELWDARQQRLTLLFDPGRIKRGLKPREEVGPVLEEGKRYTFVVDADWPDANGKPLAKGFRKSFRSGPPDDQQIDLAQWKVTAPGMLSPEPLSIQFPKALDEAMAKRLIWVETAKGDRVTGFAILADREHRWEWIRQQPWPAGDYRIAVDATVEDLAGNSVDKPFEIDVLRPVQKKVEQKIHYLPFAVR